MNTTIRKTTLSVIIAVVLTFSITDLYPTPYDSFGNNMNQLSSGKLVLTADTLEELKELEEDIIEQGWHSEGKPVQNPDRTWSITMTKN